jgi:hypothetical protein
MARRKKVRAGTRDPADDVRLVADFVRRLRRVALHPLALDENGTGRPGSYLCRLGTHLGTVEYGPDHTATVRLELPDEVQFESLATRLRSFTIESDRLFWRDVLDALDRLTGLDGHRLGEASQWFHQAWAKATERGTPNERAYRTGYRVGDDHDGEQQHFTDIDMAFAWLYEDVAHGDEVSTGYFDVMERYRAAVQVFSHLAVVAIQTLHYINDLVARGLLALPVGTFTDPVVVRDLEYTRQMYYFETEVGADLSVLDNVVPEHLRPALELSKNMMAVPGTLGRDSTGVP